MIHHLSLAVHDPLRVAQVVAELWQGRTIPFPHHPGSYFAVSLDSYGTAIEFFPKDTVLKPDSTSVGFYNASAATAYTATHANLAVPISETEIYQIADREGWRAVRCRRADLFDLIEFWVENEVLLELMPPSLMEEYLASVQPETLELILNSALFERN